ncbi:MAG: HAD-IA family hydrolase [Pseudomonadota bacterium]
MADTPLRLVIFDVDGTLVDSQVSILASMQHAFTKAGRPIPSREAALGVIGLSLQEAMAVLAPGATKAEHLQLAEDYKNGHTTHRETGAAVANQTLFPGALDAIHRLNDAGYLLSAATGKSRRGLNRFLAAHGLDRIFLGTQTADDAPSKPHPQMVLNCLSAAGVDPANAVMIGDTEFDMAMGQAAGCHTIGVGWGYHDHARILRGGARQIASTFDDLDGLVDDLWQGQGRT